jgi:hypothetical protein
MKRLGQALRHWLPLILLAAAAAVGVVGCASTDETDNVSSRPWNAPKGWETGMPSGMYDRQR